MYAPVGQAEQEGEGTVVVLPHDLASAGKHRAAIPAGEADAPVPSLGVGGQVASVDARTEGSEHPSVVRDDPDLALSTPLASSFQFLSSR